jgi:tRNA(His) 5'-end guanylyltransferase
MRDELGARMKEFYEAVPKTKLTRRIPVAIRIDGKAFHTFTRGFTKPFDEVLIRTMTETTKYLCENIQGCVFGYTQSDEITLILVDYQNLNTSAWFDYEVQKICSVSASMATLAFNKYFAANVWDFGEKNLPNFLEGGYNPNNFTYEDSKKLVCYNKYKKSADQGAMFDARCFNIPKEEVANLIYWRQLDAMRNSIQMVGQANFSHRELQGKSCNDIKNMLIEEKLINWDELPTYQKQGSCCIKKENKWVIDKEIPVFKGGNREYVDNLIFI